MSERLLRHVVLFKFTDETIEEQLAEVGESILDIPNLIDSVHAVEWGAALNDNPRYTHCMTLTCLSEDALKAYMRHPVHIAAIQRTEHLYADVTHIDYWA